MRPGNNRNGTKLTRKYDRNSKSKVPYFIPAERIPALSWQAWLQLVRIFTTSGETRIVDQRTRSSFGRQCSTAQCCRNRESRISGAGKFFHIHHTALFGTVGLPYIPKDEKSPQRFHSNEDVQNEVKKWLRA
jgi:hypothetical protein